MIPPRQKPSAGGLWFELSVLPWSFKRKTSCFFATFFAEQGALFGVTCVGDQRALLMVWGAFMETEWRLLPTATATLCKWHGTNSLYFVHMLWHANRVLVFSDQTGSENRALFKWEQRQHLHGEEDDMPSLITSLFSSIQFHQQTNYRRFSSLQVIAISSFPSLELCFFWCWRNNG